MDKPHPPRLFLDANVLFSAAYSSEGRSHALFELARENVCLLISSRYAFEEAERNLLMKNPEVMKRFYLLMKQIRFIPEGPPQMQQKAQALRLHPEDSPILAAAVGHADLLVTGDRKHFGPWFGKTMLGLKIQSLAEALKMLLH